MGAPRRDDDEGGAFSGLTLRDHIPGGLGHEAERIRRARLTAAELGDFESFEEFIQWTRPSTAMEGFTDRE